MRGYIFEIIQNIKNNKLKINETFYEDRILNKEYDVVINLNKEFLFDISLIVNNLKSIYKIGIKHQYSDYFYNMIYDYNHEDVLEKIYNWIYLMFK